MLETTEYAMEMALHSLVLPGATVELASNSDGGDRLSRAQAQTLTARGDKTVGHAEPPLKVGAENRLVMMGDFTLVMLTADIGKWYRVTSQIIHISCTQSSKMFFPFNDEYLNTSVVSSIRRLGILKSSSVDIQHPPEH